MKKTKFRLTALLCAVLLCLSACGATPKTPGAADNPPTLGNPQGATERDKNGARLGTDENGNIVRYLKKDVDLPNAVDGIRRVMANTTNIYILSAELTETADSAVFYKLDLDGNVLERNVYTWNDGYRHDIYGASVDENGNIWLLEYIWDIQRDSEGRNQSTTLVKHYVENLSGGGFTVDYPGHTGGSVLWDIKASGGTIYLCTDSGVCCFTLDGKFNGATGAGLKPYKPCIVDNTMCFIGITADSQKLTSISSDGKPTMNTPLDESVTDLIGGAGLYVTDGLDLYSIDPETGYTSFVLNWVTSGVTGRYKEVIALENGSFLHCEPFDVSIIWPNEINASELKTLRLATMNSAPLEQLAIDFNSRSAEYILEIIDYSQFNTKDAPENGVLQLNTDIITGKAPDIVDLASLPLEQYESAGLFEDLSPYFARNDSPRMVKSFMDALKRGNAIYAFVPAGEIMTIMTNADDVKDMGELGFDDILKIQEKMDNNCEPFGKMISRRDFLKAMLSVGNSKYLDWQNGTCNFDDSFKDLLRVAANIPEEAELQFYGEKLAEGELVTHLNNVTMMPSLVSADFNFGMNLKLNGIPTVEGGGLVLCPIFMLGMSSTSQYKEGVWQFMCMTLQDKYQSDFSRRMLPASVKGMDMAWEDANHFLDMGEYDELDSAGNLVTVKIDRQKYTALMQYAIDNVTSIYQPNPALFDIVWRESQPYFHGDKTVDEVTKTIEASAKLYISEHQ